MAQPNVYKRQRPIGQPKTKKPKQPFPQSTSTHKKTTIQLTNNQPIKQTTSTQSTYNKPTINCFCRQPTVKMGVIIDLQLT